MLYDKRWEKEIEVVLEPWQQIIIGAIEILETRGWIQHRPESSRGFCVMGALQLAAHKTNSTGPHLNMAATTLASKIRGGPVGWNDTPGRTKEEVINMLREVAYGHSQG